MALLTIKDISENLHQRLKQSALQHCRSVNEEAIFCLERALTDTRVDPERFLARARSLRARTPRVFLTQKDLRTVKNYGHPNKLRRCRL
jgi:plasmid stability protein